MADFLETQAISHELLRLIKGAKEKIILISPYLKVNELIKERLKTKRAKNPNFKIIIIYGKSELNPREINWMNDLHGLELFEKQNIHAKCYLNETNAIICSMNLYDYSQENNIEMGLLISREKDAKAFNDLIDEIHNIQVNCKKIALNNQRNEIIQEPVTLKNGLTKDKKELQQGIIFDLRQRALMAILKHNFLDGSMNDQNNFFGYLNDEQIIKIILNKPTDIHSFKNIVPEETVEKIGESILFYIDLCGKMVIGKILSVLRSTRGYGWKVKLKNLESGIENWYITTNKKMIEGQIIAASINKDFLNQHYYVEM